MQRCQRIGQRAAHREQRLDQLDIAPRDGRGLRIEPQGSDARVDLMLAPRADKRCRACTLPAQQRLPRGRRCHRARKLRQQRTEPAGPPDVAHQRGLAQRSRLKPFDQRHQHADIACYRPHRQGAHRVRNPREHLRVTRGPILAREDLVAHLHIFIGARTVAVPAAERPRPRRCSGQAPRPPSCASAPRAR